jgi:hypothetical protein
MFTWLYHFFFRSENGTFILQPVGPGIHLEVVGDGFDFECETRVVLVIYVEVLDFRDFDSVATTRFYLNSQGSL